MENENQQDTSERVAVKTDKSKTKISATAGDNGKAIAGENVTYVEKAENVNNVVLVIQGENKAEAIIKALSQNSDLNKLFNFIVNNDTGSDETLKPIIEAIAKQLGIKSKKKANDEASKIVDNLRKNWEENEYNKKVKNPIMDLILLKAEDKEIGDLTKRFAKVARGQFTVFISAITDKQGEGETDKTLEYLVALKLKEKLKIKGCNVFWWEDSILFDDANLNDLWSISTKISMGLAFSSLFIGLAFDSVTKKDGGKYTYNCILTDENAYKTPNYFKYEVEKFDNLRTAQNLKTFIKPVLNKNFRRYAPQGKDKRLKFYTLGNPESFEGAYEIFNDKGGYLTRDVNESIRKVYEDKAVVIENKAERIANIILNNISQDGYLENLIKKQNEFIDKQPEQHVVHAKLPQEPAYFKPFGGKGAFLAEDVVSVPSDYIFKYAVLDSRGESAKEHFTIFPEKEMKPDGWNWSLKLLIKDWNYSKSKIDGAVDSLKLSENAYVSLDDKEAESAERKIYLYENDKDTTNRDGVIELTHENDHSYGHTSGSIYDNGVKLYRFEVLFLPKRVLHYKYSGSRKTFVLSDLDGVNKADFTYEVYSSGVKRKDETHRQGGEQHGISGSIKVKNSNDDYVLNPSGDTANYYVMLKDNKSERDKPIEGRKTRCPYCGRFIGSNKEECHSGNKCSWNFIYNYFDNGGDSKSDINAAETARKNFYFHTLNSVDAENVKKWLPEPSRDDNKIYRDDFNKTAVISILGKSQSGKSTFISSMFSARYGDDSMARPDCEYVNKTLKGYVEKVECCATNGPVGSKGKTERGNISTLNLMGNYSPRLYNYFIAGTPTDKSELISHIPYTMELTNVQGRVKKACLSFYDAPGSFILDTKKTIGSDTKTNRCQFLESDTIDSTMVFRSDCLIVLVNGAGETAFSSARYLLDELRGKYESNNIDRSKVAVAVVLCKFDMFASKFNENSYLRTTPLVVKGSRLKFEDSPIHNYINNCSAELANFINESGSEEFVNAVENFTDHYKFFAVSAIGRKDSVKDNKKLYFTEPSNIENVLLWIMYKTGIIK